MPNLTIEIIFWCSAALIIYSYALYAPLIWLLSRFFGRRAHPPAPGERDLPSISLLIAAHDEEQVMEARLRNALATDYPKHLLEIVVASDGSTDATAEIALRYADDGVRLFDYADQRGKSSRLNETIPHLRGDVIVFSDANTMLEPSALRKLARWFDDESIGAVCGRLVLTDPITGRNVDSLYWRYETFLKRCESRLGALLGSNGAIYALRRELYRPIPDSTLVDDFVIPLLAKQRTGCAIAYDSEAIAHEETPRRIGTEFRRRARIGAGGFQSIALLWRLLDPRRGWVALTFFSHKILRWLCPFFMLAMIGTNLLLLDRPVYRAIAAAQVTFYALSMAAACVPLRPAALKPLKLATMFTAMNAALLVGFFRWIAGAGGAWRRTAR